MRIAIGVMVVLFALLQYRLWFADGGLLEVHKLREQVAEQREQNERLRERNRALAAEVRDLKKGLDAVEAPVGHASVGQSPIASLTRRRVGLKCDLQSPVGAAAGSNRSQIRPKPVVGRASARRSTVAFLTRWPAQNRKHHACSTA